MPPSVTVAAKRVGRCWSLASSTAGLVALTIALRVPFATAPLGIDEGGLAFVARGWGDPGRSLYGPYWVDRPPLLLALFKLAGLAGPLGIRLLGAGAAGALVVAVSRLATAVGTRRTGRVAGLVTAMAAGSYALRAVFTPGELLAAVPAALSVLCLLRSRAGDLRRLFGAGVLATSAFLVKQSFVDALAAGVVCVAADGLAQRRVPVRRLATFAAGALVPLLGIAAWFAVVPRQAGQFPYALIGFRIDGLHALAVSNLPIPVRLRRLGAPALGSGLILALAVAPMGLRRRRHDRALTATLGAWTGTGLLGVLGGGSYWAHYLIQLIAPAAVLCAVGLDAAPRVRRGAGLFAIVAVVLAVNGLGAIGQGLARGPRSDVAVADFIRARAKPGDTQYVMYARANVDYYSGLPSPFPYAWSLMLRTIPGARGQLVRLLASPRRPTWVVGWQAPRRWGLDPDGRIAADLRRSYRVEAVIDGHRVYHRRAPAGQRSASAGTGAA